MTPQQYCLALQEWSRVHQRDRHEPIGGVRSETCQTIEHDFRIWQAINTWTEFKQAMHQVYDGRLYPLHRVGLDWLQDLSADNIMDIHRLIDANFIPMDVRANRSIRRPNVEALATLPVAQYGLVRWNILPHVFAYASNCMDTPPHSSNDDDHGSIWIPHGSPTAQEPLTHCDRYLYLFSQMAPSVYNLLIQGAFVRTVLVWTEKASQNRIWLDVMKGLAKQSKEIKQIENNRDYTETETKTTPRPKKKRRSKKRTSKPKTKNDKIKLLSWERSPPRSSYYKNL